MAGARARAIATLQQSWVTRYYPEYGPDGSLSDPAAFEAFVKDVRRAGKGSNLPVLENHSCAVVGHVLLGNPQLGGRSWEVRWAQDLLYHSLTRLVSAGFWNMKI